eukprot:m.231558 g.231558  ORF g.231558 m.231558 type:complete len:416 (-) comp13899_c1_seq16:1198-2445(-)
MQVSLSIFICCVIAVASAQELAVDRYRRTEIDPVNLAAEISAIEQNVAESDSTLSNIHSQLVPLAQGDRLSSLSNQVSILQNVASNRALNDEVAALSNLVDIISTNANSASTVATANSDVIPDMQDSVSTAVSLATELFVNRLNQTKKVANLEIGLNKAQAIIANLKSLASDLEFYTSDGAFNVKLLSSQREKIETLMERAMLPSHLLNHFGKNHFGNSSLPVMRWQQWSTYSQWNGQWYMGNNAALYGGVSPNTWGDSSGRAYQMKFSPEYMRAFFNKKVYCGWNCAVHNEEWYSYSSSNSMHGGVFMRIRNTSPNDIAWPISFLYSSYSGWGEYASVSVNGNNQWNTGSNCHSCNVKLDLNLPKKSTSSVVVISGSSAESGTRTMHLSFIDNCLQLPDGLEWVDDLDDENVNI